MKRHVPMFLGTGLPGGGSITQRGDACVYCRHDVRMHERDGCVGAKKSGKQCRCGIKFTQVDEYKVDRYGKRV